MAIVTPNSYAGDGRINGSYVYLLMCAVDDRIHVKIGMTDQPTRRLYSLANGCPIPPELFATVNIYSRKAALALERALHEAMKEWRCNGEWFSFGHDDKAAFNARWKLVFEKFAKPSWPLAWSKIPVSPVMKIAKAKQRHWLVRNKRGLQIVSGQGSIRPYCGDAASRP